MPKKKTKKFKVPNKLRELMFKHNIKYEDVAVFVGCQVKTVTSVAAGNASAPIREAFATLLHCKVSDIWPNNAEASVQSDAPKL